jgi:SAM-dependent methyltransferase
MKFSNPDKALREFIDIADGHVLNIGDVNTSPHTMLMREHGLDVTTISYCDGSDIVGDYNVEYCGGKSNAFDAIWCAHCLEHQLNVHDFLRKIFLECKEDGVVCITVPPLKHEIVGGHVSLWNAGLLIYNMILAEFDCSHAKVIVDGYNISVLVRKKQAYLPELSYDTGDIEKLARYFPFPVKQGFNGDIKECF